MGLHVVDSTRCERAQKALKKSNNRSAARVQVCA
jgi:hypothetical protein